MPVAFQNFCETMRLLHIVVDAVQRSVRVKNATESALFKKYVAEVQTKKLCVLFLSSGFISVSWR